MMTVPVDNRRRLAAGICLDTVLAAANLLLILLVGQWLFVTGGLCLIIYLLTLLFAALGRLEQRALLSDALLVGTLMNFNGWAFSHLSNLLVFIGLFFFALFGLLMGATLYRFLSHFRPIGKPALIACGMILVLGAWWGALVLEASYLPADAVDYSLRNMRRLPEGVTRLEHDHKILSDVRAYLSSHYGSTGIFGYLRWALQEGQMELILVGHTKPMLFELNQRGGWFGVRLALSLLLLCYGVFSQLRHLDRTADHMEPLTPQEDAPEPVAPVAENG